MAYKQIMEEKAHAVPTCLGVPIKYLSLITVSNDSSGHPDMIVADALTSSRSRIRPWSWYLSTSTPSLGLIVTCA